MDVKTIGEQIAKLRRERNMTQAQLADKLYVTEKAVSKWECGNGIPSIENIGELAEVFEISIDELLGAGGRKEQEAMTAEQIWQLQESNSPLINSYEDIVVYSSHLSCAAINRLAEKFIDTITQFEEIIYLMDYFTPELLQKMCLYHKDKIMPDTDLSPLSGQIDNDCFVTLCRCRQPVITAVPTEP